MKYPILLLFIFCFFTAKAQSWVWAKGCSGSGGDAQEPCGFAIDQFGNLYAIGLWGLGGDTLNFGTNTFIDTNGHKYFIVKYDSGGNLIWSKALEQSGTEGVEWSCDINCDNLGNILVVGTFYAKKLIIGTDTLINSSTCYNGSDGFLAKLDPYGNVIWLRGIRGDCSEYISSVVTDSHCNVYITGGSQLSAHTFFNQYTLVDSMIENLFIAKYDSSGNVKWIKTALGTSNNRVGGEMIISDNSDGIYVIGNNMLFPISFDGISVTQGDLFVVKYDTSGSIKWAEEIGGGNNILASKIAVDLYHNIYLAGSFNGGAVNISNHILNNIDPTGNSEDIFIAKYDNNGNNIWVKDAGTLNSELVGDIITDNLGRLYVAGGYDLLGQNAPFQIDSTVFIPPVGVQDPMFMVVFDTSGHIIEHVQLASGGDDFCGLATDNHSNLFFCGDYFAIDTFVIGNDTLRATSSENFFIAKYTTGLPTSIFKLNNLNNTKPLLYPNPSTGIFTIELQNANNELFHLNISNLLGQNIYNKALLYYNNGSIQQQIDLSYLPKGIYIYKLYSNTEITGTGKILIQ